MEAQLATHHTADAARINSLEEELLLARERLRSEGDELDQLRRQLRKSELARQESKAESRLAHAEVRARPSASPTTRKNLPFHPHDSNH